MAAFAQTMHYVLMSTGLIMWVIYNVTVSYFLGFYCSVF